MIPLLIAEGTSIYDVNRQARLGAIVGSDLLPTSTEALWLELDYPNRWGPLNFWNQDLAEEKLILFLPLSYLLLLNSFSISLASSAPCTNLE